MDIVEAKLIGNALFEIRLILSSYLGSHNEAATDVRFAAHLAYALHEEALALANATGFDINRALRNVAAIDGIVGTEDGRRLARLWRAGTDVPFS